MTTPAFSEETQNLQALLPRIEQWLESRGAELSRQCSEPISFTNFLLGDEIRYAYAAPWNVLYHVHRLYITTNLDPFWNTGVAVTRPEHWEKALEAITSGFSLMYVRSLKYIPSHQNGEKVNIPEHIYLQLTVGHEEAES